jgi:hypothetical protein
MTNRAKCKLCGDILESLHRHDYVTCKCGEIFIDGGNDLLRCGAKDFANFLRLDDEGNEIVVKVIDTPEDTEDNASIEPHKEDPLVSLEMFRDYCKKVPGSLPATHSDLAAVLSLLCSALRKE